MYHTFSLPPLISHRAPLSPAHILTVAVEADSLMNGCASACDTVIRFSGSKLNILSRRSASCVTLRRSASPRVQDLRFQDSGFGV